MIGIFDSGIGGLTVVKEILKQLPQYQLAYFGDTARAPYGNKSAETITQYAIEDTEFLLSQGAQVIVVACNTASAVAAGSLRKKFPEVPIFEVITPAVERAMAVTKNKRLGVIGTRATVGSHIYETLLKQMHTDCTVISKPCPLFVPLAEEGWTDQPVTKLVAKKYLFPLKQQQIDTLILGCTHYPLLRAVISQKIGKRVALVDPAEEVTAQLKQYLSTHPDISATLQQNDQHSFYFSDTPLHLSELIVRWLGRRVTPKLHHIA